MSAHLIQYIYIYIYIQNLHMCMKNKTAPANTSQRRPSPLATTKRPVALWYVPYILCTLCAIRCSFGSLCWVNVHLPLREPLEISMYLGITYKKWCLFFPMPSFQENGFLYHCASMILSPLWNIGDSFHKREKPFWAQKYLLNWGHFEKSTLLVYPWCIFLCGRRNRWIHLCCYQ